MGDYSIFKHGGSLEARIGTSEKFTTDMLFCEFNQIMQVHQLPEIPI